MLNQNFEMTFVNAPETLLPITMITLINEFRRAYTNSLLTLLRELVSENPEYFLNFGMTSEHLEMLKKQIVEHGRIGIRDTLTLPTDDGAILRIKDLKSPTNPTDPIVQRDIEGNWGLQIIGLQYGSRLQIVWSGVGIILLAMVGVCGGELEFGNIIHVKIDKSIPDVIQTWTETNRLNALLLDNKLEKYRKDPLNIDQEELFHDIKNCLNED